MRIGFTQQEDRFDAAVQAILDRLSCLGIAS
jgi:hypothetical protein